MAKRKLKRPGRSRVYKEGLDEMPVSVPVKNSRGRPEHVPDKLTRRTVERCVACGMSHKDTARAIGITHPTLEKHYADELQNGPSRFRREVIGMLIVSAKSGNVSAQRKLAAMTGFDIDDPVEQLDSKKKLGKKELQQNKAENVSGKYAAPEPPRLIINNSK